jgi:hypothetical protein
MTAARLLGLVGVAVAVAVSTADAAPSPKPPPAPPPGPNQFTISIQPLVVTFGDSVIVSGNLQGIAGAKLVLQQRLFPYQGKWKNNGQGSSGPSGDYTFGLTPTATTRYRVAAATRPTIFTTDVEVLVKMRITAHRSSAKVRPGGRWRVSGFVTPAHTKRPVELQKRSGGHYVTVSISRLYDVGAGRSGYSFVLRPPSSGIYRVRVPSDGNHATGTSGRMSVRVG